MENNSLFHLKTLFDPLSGEWGETGFEEKKALLSQIFSKPGAAITGMSFKNATLQKFLLEARDTNPLGDDADFEEHKKHLKKVDKENPEIPLETLLLAMGLYLNKSLLPGFQLPVSSDDTAVFLQSMRELKDSRKKKRKAIDDFIMDEAGNYGRELFDLLSHEGESTSIDEKRKKLKSAAGHGFTPAEFLFVYYYSYSSMEGYERILKEAPLSAFALLWNGEELML